MKPSKFVPYSSWSRRARGATSSTHPIGSTKGTTLHWEGPHMGAFPHSACDDKVRSIQAFHRDTRDWADIAYNALVCPHGYTYEGRGLWTMSAANGNSEDNGDWYAICYIGGEGDPFTDAAKDGFFEAVRWFRTEGGAPDRVNGHRDHKSTACPGDVIYRWLHATDFTPPPPPPPPPPVTTHTRWATRETGVHETPGGKLIRKIPAGYRFTVVDGSGHGNDGWIETGAGNWVLGKDTTIYDPAVPVPFKVGGWNVKANRSWTNVILPALTNPDDGILTVHKPDVFLMTECYDAPDLAGKVRGYTYRYQGYGYPPKNEGYIEERSEQIILVRDGVEVEIAAALEMLETWKGPNLGLMHDPRVHRRVTVEKNGKVARTIGVHTPPYLSSGFNNKAINESNAAMVECLTTFPQDEPIIIVGDWNQSNSAVVTRVGAPGGAVVDGGGIDLAVYKNCKKVKGENLGNFGSDHPVKIWTFEI